jgi:hypothetical protein
MKTPPPCAAFLLRRLRGADDPLLGDLTEEYQQERSRGWFWRQTCFAVVIAMVHDVRCHPALLLRGLLLGAVVIQLGEIATALVTPLLARGVLYPVLPGRIYTSWQVFQWTAVGAGFVVITAAAWLVAWLHHRQRVTLSLVFVLLSMPSVVFDPELGRLIEMSGTHPRFIPYLVSHVAFSASTIAALAVGGVVLRVPQSAGRVAAT